MNLHPPQTYSRLFRPWDCNRSGAMASGNSEKPTPANTESSVKRESEIESETNIKTEQSSFSGNDSDRECASSNSSTSSLSRSSSTSSDSSRHSSCKSSYEDGLPQRFSGTSTPISDRQSQQLVSSTTSPHSPVTTFTPGALFNAQLPQQTSPATASVQQLPFMPPANELYYAAAAAAAASGIGSAPTAAGGAFGMDPYTLGLMEHEYARVMAEDAHLKALNSRKQRPKKFKCPHCDVAFSNNGQLKGHIRIHTGERPFKCDVESCGKTFTRNEELTRHKRIHTGLRPYPCTACGKKFGRRDHLKKHMKTHMPQERQLGPIFVPMYPYLYGY